MRRHGMNIVRQSCYLIHGDPSHATPDPLSASATEDRGRVAEIQLRYVVEVRGRGWKADQSRKTTSRAPSHWLAKGCCERRSTGLRSMSTQPAHARESFLARVPDVDRSVLR